MPITRHHLLGSDQRDDSVHKGEQAGRKGRDHDREAPDHASEQQMRLDGQVGGGSGEDDGVPARSRRILRGERDGKGHLGAGAVVEESYFDRDGRSEGYSHGQRDKVRRLLHVQRRHIG